MCNLVLVGFMATGKTTIGRMLAERLGYRFVDMDDQIVAREGRSIHRIFAESGEACFRRIERALVGELAATRGCVIGTGGGIVLDPANLRDFAATGFVICLDARPPAILARVAGDTSRPLLAGQDREARVRQLLADRAPLYAAVPNHIDTSDLTAAEVADRIAARYRVFLADPPPSPAAP